MLESGDDAGGPSGIEVGHYDALVFCYIFTYYIPPKVHTFPSLSMHAYSQQLGAFDALEPPAIPFHLQYSFHSDNIR